MSNTNCVRLVRHEVLPGSSTGVYFIFVDNLPQGYTYKDLRGIVRCERCFIYPNSCAGWVRVRGLDNYRRWSTFLNGLYLRDSTLSTSDINEHQPAYVWDRLRTANTSEYNAFAAPRRGRRLCLDMTLPAVLGPGPRPGHGPEPTAPSLSDQDEAAFAPFVGSSTPAYDRLGWQYRFYEEDNWVDSLGVWGAGPAGPAGPAGGSSNDDNGSEPAGHTGPASLAGSSSVAGQQPLPETLDERTLARLVVSKYGYWHAGEEDHPAPSSS